MVIDTSALLAILNNEPDAVAFEAAVEKDPIRLMSVGTYLETAIVVESRKGEAGGRELDLWLHRAEVELVPVDVEHADLARSAYRRYGRGRHPAGLNYGDCFAYALAKSSAEPLLFKGEDFSQTDVASVEAVIGLGQLDR
jgi:ribonuclease VapC